MGHSVHTILLSVHVWPLGLCTTRLRMCMQPAGCACMHAWHSQELFTCGGNLSLQQVVCSLDWMAQGHDVHEVRLSTAARPFSARVTPCCWRSCSRLPSSEALGPLYTLRNVQA
jgi:hypothetical protein